MLSYRSVDIRKALQLEELLAREEFEYIIEEEVAKQTIRTWLEGCLKKIRAQNVMKQQNSLIAGLRATNELQQKLISEQIDEKSKEVYESEIDVKDTENVKVRKKLPHVLNRSDSTGSTSGRKFLAPTLSDPQAARNDKDRYTNKKKPPRQQTTSKNNLQLNEVNYTQQQRSHVEEKMSNKTFAQTSNHNLLYEVHDWWQEQMICTQSSDEE